MTVGERVFDLTCSICESRGRGVYALRVRCSNCGASGIGNYSKTHAADVGRCPDCETTNVRPVPEQERLK